MFSNQKPERQDKIYKYSVNACIHQYASAKDHLYSGTNLNNHFSAGHVALSLCGLLLSLMHHSFTCRPILQCKVTHRLAEHADFQLTAGLLRVAEILQKSAKPVQAVVSTADN